ncbi:acyclic terpene utilization AtuA family protein [Bosea sp. LjRoot237]|uniref:acyclic terpene utilization AtuA family protein n=1 Tax=Bosea sp. LjRoot237 TaxID=3342292 RepID=UPI003ECF41A8
MSAVRESIRIGCGAGFWGDSPEGPRQLVQRGGIDYLVLDYLAEITMSILARMKAKNPALGYATDFVSLVMKPLAREIAEKRIRVVTNAGGVNPQACRDALLAAFKEVGVDLKVAIVTGDDLSGEAEHLRTAGVTEMFSGAPFPERTASINAYLGAFPIAAALAAGADVVVTGRCVDSAVVLGPLIHEFGWSAEDYDRLSAGSLAGHILECGAQATGGIVTDWREVAGDWADMGFPFADCRADGSFEISKPEGTGGRISPATIAEQIVYEVGDPAAYMLPDVTCDWSQVKLEASGPDRVRVSGARGRAPSGSYKVSATYPDGYRCATTMMIVGDDAAERAEAVARAILSRCGRLIRAAGFPDFAETSVETLGAEASYGARSRARATREVVLKIGVRHPSREALQIFAREIYPAATAMAQSLTGFAGGRPEPQPVIRLFSFLIDKAELQPTVSLGAASLPVPAHIPLAAANAPSSVAAAMTSTDLAVEPDRLSRGELQAREPSPGTGEGWEGAEPTLVDYGAGPLSISPPFREREAPHPARDQICESDRVSADADVAEAASETTAVPLVALAFGRSGDKGDIANIGVIARDAAFVPWLKRALTPEAVGRYFAHHVAGKVERFDWPGLGGFNLVMHRALGGGGIASLRHDPQGKAMAQVLMSLPVPVPASWLAPGGPLQAAQSSEGGGHPLPPACGGEGLGMGGRKAGLAHSSEPRQAALPPTQPSPPQAGGGLVLRRRARESLLPIALPFHGFKTTGDA